MNDLSVGLIPAAKSIEFRERGLTIAPCPKTIAATVRPNITKEKIPIISESIPVPSQQFSALHVCSADLQDAGRPEGGGKASG